MSAEARQDPADDLRALLAAGRAVGTFLKLPATAGVDMAATLFDFVVIDREHSLLGEADALQLVRHAAALGLPALVRLPALDAAQANRALEAGAAGIQLSQVRTGAEVRALRAACEYAPGGRRSVSLAHPVAGYGSVGLRDHVERSAGRPIVVAQLESVESADAYRDVLAARPDAAFIGTADLAVDAAFDEERVERCIAEIRDGASRERVTLGAFGRVDDDQVRYLIVSSDLAMLRDGMAAARQGAAQGPTQRGGQG